MTTRERIVDEALSLFAIYGYRGTSVKKIADAVGVKDSSLYKHFKSKQEIFDTIVLEMKKRMERLGARIGLPDENDFAAASIEYGKMDLDTLIELSKKIFIFYLKDDFISRFWRMANMEQYQNPEIYDIYQKIFMEESIVYQTKLFAQMISDGIFDSDNPHAVAMNFYTPIFFLLCKYNGRTESEEQAIEELESQIREFYRIYNKNKIRVS